MAEPLSLAASIFAVIGAADVVLRASIEFSHFLAAVKDAPADVERLRTSLQETTLLVETAKHYLEELKDCRSFSPASPQTVGLGKALSCFTSCIRALERELVSLVALVRRYDGACQSWGRIKWILDERKLGKSMQKLETSKVALTTALVLVGRFVVPEFVPGSLLQA